MDEGQRDERLRSLHQRLLAGDPGGLEEAFTVLHEPLLHRLGGRPRFRRTDPHLIEDAILDAIREYFDRPAGFDARGGRRLEQHLELAAERNLLNLLRGEARRHRHQGEAAARTGRTAESDVELRSPAGNAIQREEADRRARERQRLLSLLSDPRDRRVLELRLDGVRDTRAFAEALGIGHLPVDEQRRLVKRAKDRIDKVLRRANHDGSQAAPGDPEAGPAPG